MSSVPNDRPCGDDHLLDCQAALAIARLEHDLRTVSLHLWVAGWTPDDVLDHVRRRVDDRRAGDLMGLVLLVDDSLRSDRLRPPEWRESIERLRAAAGARVDDLRPGWIARWIRTNSTYETSRQVAELLSDVETTLITLLRPPLEPTVRGARRAPRARGSA